MAGFSKIIVDIDPLARQHPALAQAADLAKRAGASLTIVDVVEDVPSQARGYLPQALEVELLARRAERLEAAADKHRTKGSTITTKTLRGRAVVAIVREVIRGKYDLLVRYHGRDVKKGQPLGEVDHQLLRKCPCPVWLVGVGEKTRPKRVLAAVHPESDDEAAQELNRRIIRAAAEVTGLERGKLTVMTAWAPFGLSLMDDRLTKRELSEVKSLAHDRAALELDRLLSTVGEVGVPYKAELVQGDPAKAIAALVKKEKIDLVVMGTVARSGLIGAIMGNTAERMIRTIRASLLALKPVDFKCPIRPE